MSSLSEFNDVFTIIKSTSEILKSVSVFILSTMLGMLFLNLKRSSDNGEKQNVYNDLGLSAGAGAICTCAHEGGNRAITYSFKSKQAADSKDHKLFDIQSRTSAFTRVPQTKKSPTL